MRKLLLFRVEKTNPSEQGLKHEQGFPIFSLKHVEKTNPSEQGLKPHTQIANLSIIGKSKKLIHQNKD